MSRHNNQEKKKRTAPPTSSLSAHLAQDAAPSQQSDDYVVDKHDREAKRVQVLKPVKLYFINKVDFKNYRLQKQSQKFNSHI